MTPRFMPAMFATLAAGALATQACDRELPTTTAAAVHPPAIPTPPPAIPTPAPAGVSYTISGVVYDDTPSGRRPISGVTLDVVSGRAVMATSDSSGHYTAAVWGDVVTIAPIVSSLFMAPCPAGTDAVGQNPSRSFDVDVVSSNLLSTSGLPDSYQTSGAEWLYASGTVTEASIQGPQPVSGALVELGADTTGAFLGTIVTPGSLAYSATLTDGSGRYLVCTAPRGSGTDQSFPLTVRKIGYAVAVRVVYPGWNEGGDGIGGSGYDVTLVRQP